MEGSNEGSPPPSLCMIRAAELFPKSKMEREDGLAVPFKELAGEFVRYLGRTDDGVVALSNYRLFLLKTKTSSETSIPLGLIESAQIRDLFHLIISCKDASTEKCSFETAEQCSEWQRRITLSVGVPETLESLFAFPFYSWTSDVNGLNTINLGIHGEVLLDDDWNVRLRRSTRFDDDFRKEVERLQFDLKGAWRISNANSEFKLCPSYPQQILVPFCISDDTLYVVANFRGSRRLPAVTWRHKLSGAVIARCSQPEVGWLGWRNSMDEELLKALADACAFDRCEENRRRNLSTTSDESTSSSPDGSHEEVPMDEVRKILIVDARSYSAAVTNRARGGGCECIEYYPCAEIEFMNLGNIHAIRKSFHALRQLCASPPDNPNWLGLLEKTAWLQHLSGLLAAAMTVSHAIEKKGRPVLVHCSDGWDRTPQIIATAKLCLDPYYRTVEGFRILVETEWLNFGHKFGDRCGHGVGSEDINERCPIFLQWLDIVHQIHKQFTCSFEFSMAYLIKLVQHSHSCLFGTFLCNTFKERTENSLFERSFSVWPFLSGSMYKNPLYVPNKEKVLWPAHNLRDLYLWTEVYLGSLGNQNTSDFPQPSNNAGSMSPVTKTRSYGDLIAVGHQNGIIRRSSDPNMTRESNLITEINNCNDNLSSEIKPSDEIIATIHDTTQKLQHLTNELNQSQELCNFTNGLESGIKELNMMYEKSDNDDSYDESNNITGLKDLYEINLVNGDKTSLNNISQNGRKNSEKNEEDYRNESDNLIDIDCVDNGSNYNTDNSPKNTETKDPSNQWYGSVTTSTDTLVPIESNKDNEKDLVSSLISSKPEETVFSRKLSNSSMVLPGVHSKILHSNGESSNLMEESILIVPEHQKLEIASSGKCEAILNNPTTVRRRRTSSTNSYKNDISLKNFNGSCVSSAPTSRFSTPGLRSLPLTPPSGALNERVLSALSCPDGLSHALSEQNIRLQQIVYEHKIREEALLHELHGMRIALLKKICPNCNNMPNEESVDVKCVDEFCKENLYSSKNRDYGESYLNYRYSPDSSNNGLDNIESVSNCSWEAVEDRSAASSNSTQITNGTLWVPDHAVSKCTSCQAFFWLGRRKHHCRSCGKIFCSECSEFWAPLPDERLFNPVRLCGACYHVVTSRMMQQNQKQNKIITEIVNNEITDQSQQNFNNNSIMVSNEIVEESCRTATSSFQNDRGSYKAATASN